MNDRPNQINAPDLTGSATKFQVPIDENVMFSKEKPGEAITPSSLEGKVVVYSFLIIADF